MRGMLLFESRFFFIENQANFSKNSNFMFSFSTDVKELGPLLATICMSLVPLIESYSKEANSMLDYLLIKNKDSLKEHLSDLFFINDMKISPNISTRVISQMKQIRQDILTKMEYSDFNAQY